MAQTEKAKPNWDEVPPRNWEEEQAWRVGAEVRRLRGKRSAQWVADRTRELGCEVKRAVVSDLEVGRRRYVTVSELIILARALDTAPIALLYPYPYIKNADIQALPAPPGEDSREVPKIDAVQWFTGVLNIFPLNSLGLSLVEQQNYYSSLQGLERARKVFELVMRNQKLNVQLGRIRARRRDGETSVSDADIDDLVSQIDDNQDRIDYLLSLGDRDLAAEHAETFWNEHVSGGNGG